MEDKIDKIIHLLEVNNELLAIVAENTTKKTKSKKPKSKKVYPPLEEQINPFRNTYAPSMLEDFLLYWTEEDRWMKQKTWDVGKRLQRWKKKRDEFDWQRQQRETLRQVDETPVRRTQAQIDGAMTSISDLLNR